MRRKFDLVFSAAISCALLSSCGGGGSPTPTPTPSPTPTPTASATPVVFDFVQATSATSAMLAISADFTPTGGSAVFNDASRISGASLYTYAISPETVSFTFPDLATTPSFLGTERTATSATSRTYTRGTTSLRLDVPFTQTMRATYVRTDPFTRNTTAGDLLSSRIGLFVVPQATATAALTGSITYAGTPQVVGGTGGTTPAGAASAAATSFTLTAATAPTVTGTIRITETLAGVPTEKAVLAFSGTMTSTTATNITGTITDTANGFSGTFSGSLSGPAREEMALVFSVTHADGRKYVGNLIAD